MPSRLTASNNYKPLASLFHEISFSASQSRILSTLKYLSKPGSAVRLFLQHSDPLDDAAGMNRALIIYCDRLDPGAGMIEGLHATLKRVLTSTNPYSPRHPRMRLTKITPCKEIAEIGGYPESLRLSDIGDRNSNI
jgi:hypothetical protein